MKAHMNESDATVSPAVDDACRGAILEALARTRRSTRDERDTWFLSATMPVGLESPSPPTIVGPLGTAAGWVDNATATDIRKLVARYIPGGVTFTGSDRDDRNIAAARILAAMQPQEVIASLSLGGRHTIAARIRELHEMAGDGAPDETPIRLTSLRELALFFMKRHQLADPEIGLSPDGLLQAEWMSAEGGVLAMKFLPDGMIQFAAVSAADRAGRRLRVCGVLPKDRVLEAVRAFIPSMDGPGAQRPAA